jgi:hypothetical protein
MIDEMACQTDLSPPTLSLNGLSSTVDFAQCGDQTLDDS